jgi:hypothetical protein
MKTNWFNKLETINWTRLWWIVGIVACFWTGIITLVPADVFKYVAIPLNALQVALAFAARGTKYVVNRIEPPVDGKI